MKGHLNRKGHEPGHVVAYFVVPWCLRNKLPSWKDTQSRIRFFARAVRRDRPWSGGNAKLCTVGFDLRLQGEGAPPVHRVHRVEDEVDTHLPEISPINGNHTSGRIILSTVIAAKPPLYFHLKFSY